MTQWEKELQWKLEKEIQSKTAPDTSYVARYLIPIIIKAIGTLPEEDYANYKTASKNG